MAGKDIITMSQKELKRLHVIRNVLDKKLRQAEAAEVLGIVDRQVRRIVKRVREEGDKGIIHASRGRPSNRAFSSTLKERIIKLYRQKYRDFGPTFANEKLFEIDKIKLGDQTLRNWLIEDGAWQVNHRQKKHLKWRERKHHFGQMLQMDGSHHDWFEGRGPECVLMGYIDDATNTSFARFYAYEGTFPAMDSFKRYIKRYGIPSSVYLDKHTTYKSTKKPTIEDELNRREPLTQFSRALEELGVEVIHAHSPAAKGRVERLFQTFQDRLIKDMRLRGIKTIEEANNFLDSHLSSHNKRFSFKALENGDLHRPLPRGVDLDSILCLKTERALRNDFTVAHNGKLYQVFDHINANKVTVEERMRGWMFITHKEKRLRYKEITKRPEKEEPKKTYTFKLIRPPIPTETHPWKTPVCRGGYKYIKHKKTGHF